MKKIILVLFVLFGATQLTFGQIYYEEEVEEQPSQTEKPSNSLKGLSFADRSYFGGNLALSFGTNTYVDVSPLMGYMVNRDFSVGLGATYIYSSRRVVDISTGQEYKLTANLFGGRAFLRHRVIDNVYFHAEFESINNEIPLVDGTRVRQWIPGAFIGGGIFQPAFGRGGVSLFVLYNVMHDDIKSPYASPWVLRAGFTL